MFTDFSYLIADNPRQLNYGVAVADINGDGAFELLVAGFGFRNLALHWTGARFEDIATAPLADADRQAIGVAAADLDGDGEEEIYIMNTDTFGGPKRYSDRLLDHDGEGWVDLFSLAASKGVLNMTAGRSVVAVDRRGMGIYGFYVANYGGPTRLYEIDEDGLVYDAAPTCGIDLVTGGRSAVSLPLFSHQMDIFAANELGANFLFRNLGNGMFEEVAAECGVSDPMEHGRGIAVLDADGDGRFDIVSSNWEGAHRLFVQDGRGIFRNIAPAALAQPGRARTVIAADFDNDGYEEIFFNNIGEPNRLFKGIGAHWQQVDIGQAAEPFGLGTGAAVGDFDGDGWLELLISHGESGVQPLSYFRVARSDHHWLRILPRTAYGAPARGAVVRLVAGGRTQIRAIDAGSGYLCQMEPVAHFGLGETTIVDQVEVMWPGGTAHIVHAPPIDCQIEVTYPGEDRLAW